MLRRNIDMSRGLANGAIGTVLSLKPDNIKPTSILVQFEGMDMPAEIPRVTADFELTPRLIATWSQFPLTLGYAMTIHKVQ